MKIVLGTPINAVPRPWLYFTVPAVMVNVLEARGDLRSRLGFEGELWLDSGGYQILRRGLAVEVGDVLEIYRGVDVEFYLSLDVPPSPADPPHVAEKKFRQTYRNWLKLEKALGDAVVPVVHIYRDPRLYFKYLELYLDAPVLAVGGAVPYVLITRGAPRGSREYAMWLIAETRRVYRGRLHVLGLGSPSVTPILAKIGVDSTDSATWRLKAAYGKVVLPGGGERHVTNRVVNFGRAKATLEDLDTLYTFLKNTGFPALDDFYQRLSTSFEYRALVNAWVVLHSREPPRSPTFYKLYKNINIVQ